MKHLGSKFFMAFIAMALLTVGLLWLVQAGLMGDSYAQARLTAARQAMQNAVTAATLDLEQMGEDANIDYVQLTADGNLLATTRGLPQMGQVIRTCQTMLGSQVDGSVQTVALGKSQNRYAILGLPRPDGSYLFGIIALADVDEASRILRDQLWLITSLLILFAVIFAVGLSQALSRPILAASAAARTLAGGNLAISLPARGRDEIGDLTDALNDLSRQLQYNENLRKELIANVSHELRAPLAVIQGYAETVRDVTWPIPERRTAQLNLIADEAARLSAVVTDILDYSRLQAGAARLQIQPVDLGTLLSGLQAKYAQAASQRHLTIEANPTDRWTVRFDPGQLEQVLVNLLNNAINHADPDSIIHLEAARLPDQPAMRLAVRNQGETIAAADLDRIWDRYYRANQVGEDRRLGTGLGLAIVRSILEHHQAPYGVTSADRSTSFWFEVPTA